MTSQEYCTKRNLISERLNELEQEEHSYYGQKRHLERLNVDMELRLRNSIQLNAEIEEYWKTNKLTGCDDIFYERESILMNIQVEQEEFFDTSMKKIDTGIRCNIEEQNQCCRERQLLMEECENAREDNHGKDNCY